MKRIMTLSAILMLGLVFFAGCSKKSDSPSYSMKATVGSTAFNVSNCYAVTTGAILNITGNTGSSTSANPPYLGITIYNYTGTGTFTINSSATAPAVAITWAPTSAITDMQAATSGTVTITSASSSTISGTFSGTLMNGSSVSGGTFTAKKM
jgi:hypothetical protein